MGSSKLHLFFCNFRQICGSERVRSLVIREGLGVEPLLLRIERSQMRWLGHLVRMTPGGLPGEVFEVRPTGRRPRGRPRTCWIDCVSKLTWERLGSPQKSWRKWPGTGTTGLLCSSCCPRDLTQIIKRQIMDGWMEGLDTLYSHTYHRTP